MNKQSFVNFNLFTIQYPLTAIISILHRLSGVFIFLCTPFLLWLLDTSLSSTAGFVHLQSLLMIPSIKIIVWLILAVLWYHLLAGIRHLLMDVGIGESLHGGRLSAKIITIITIILVILTGIWLW